MSGIIFRFLCFKYEKAGKNQNNNKPLFLQFNNFAGNCFCLIWGICMI